MRDDYKELLLLTVIFLGGVPPKGITFFAPGALHRSRWMDRLIYTLKIFMFGTTNRESGYGHFQITQKEEDGLRDFICFSIAGGYIKAWYLAPSAMTAPNTDLKFLNTFKEYATINNVLAEAAIKKFLGHLWYISEHMISLAFFDDAISFNEKNEIVQAMLTNQTSEDPSRRINLSYTKFKKTILKPSNFVTKNSIFFFETLNLPTSFLKKHPETWSQDADYEVAKQRVEALKVVNDISERTVALIQEYNETITCDEQQKQHLLQLVNHHRKNVPNFNKSTLLENINNNLI